MKLHRLYVSMSSDLDVDTLYIGETERQLLSKLKKHTNYAAFFILSNVHSAKNMITFTTVLMFLNLLKIEVF